MKNLIPFERIDLNDENFEDIKKRIETEDFIVVQWDCPTSYTNIEQEELLKTTSYKFPVIAVPVCYRNKKVDTYLKKKLNINKVTPAVTIFQKGEMQEFGDAKLWGVDKYGNPNKTRCLYGLRPNIVSFLNKMYEKYESDQYYTLQKFNSF